MKIIIIQKRNERKQNTTPKNVFKAPTYTRHFCFKCLREKACRATFTVVQYPPLHLLPFPVCFFFPCQVNLQLPHPHEAPCVLFCAPSFVLRSSRSGADSWALAYNSYPQKCFQWGTPAYPAQTLCPAFLAPDHSNPCFSPQLFCTNQRL